MDASAVADYLKKNPAFFEDYADVVAQIFVPHPHGGHAIPIAERQILSLRDRARDLATIGSGAPRSGSRGRRADEEQKSAQLRRRNPRKMPGSS